MGLLRGIGRAAPVLAAGLAAGWYLRRQGLLGAPPQPILGEPPPPPQPRAEEPLEAHVEAVAAVSDAADVTSVVEDLLAAEPEVVDAEVVEEEGSRELEELEERVREALGEIPAQVESYRGVVWLRGQLERPDAIEEAERRTASVNGVTEVRNLLHLPGTPPPSG